MKLTHLIKSWYYSLPDGVQFFYSYIAFMLSAALIVAVAGGYVIAIVLYPIITISLTLVLVGGTHVVLIYNYYRKHYNVK